MAGSDYREYENGVADVLASIVGPSATVERNVQRTGKSGSSRQIDVLVEGRIFGLADATMIVDGKRWRDNVDVADVDAFAGMVEDVGADFGILVSASASSEGAKGRARSARGVRLITMSVGELAAWRPAGTVGYAIEIAREHLEESARLLRNAGLRVAKDPDHHAGEGQVVIEVFRHYGTQHPSGEVQSAQRETIERVLGGADIDFTNTSNGLVFHGGTPAYRWLNVTFGCMKLPYKILVAREAEISEQVGGLADQCGIPASMFDVERPPGWPYSASPFDT
jgi:hypothetical protein